MVVQLLYLARGQRSDSDLNCSSKLPGYQSVCRGRYRKFQTAQSGDKSSENNLRETALHSEKSLTKLISRTWGTFLYLSVVFNVNYYIKMTYRRFCIKSSLGQLLLCSIVQQASYTYIRISNDFMFPRNTSWLYSLQFSPTIYTSAAQWITYSNQCLGRKCFQCSRSPTEHDSDQLLLEIKDSPIVIVEMS